MILRIHINTKLIVASIQIIIFIKVEISGREIQLIDLKFDRPFVLQNHFFSKDLFPNVKVEKKSLDLMNFVRRMMEKVNPTFKKEKMKFHCPKVLSMTNRTKKDSSKASSNENKHLHLLLKRLD